MEINSIITQSSAPPKHSLHENFREALQEHARDGLQDHWSTFKSSVRLSSGVDLHFVETGNTASPAVILIHGISGSSRGWSLIAPELGRHYHLFMLDLRGHGSTPATPTGYSIATLSEDILEFMDLQGLSRATLVGHSMGAAIAQYLALREPERVEKLAMIGATARSSENPGTLKKYQAFRGPNFQINDQFITDWVSDPIPLQPSFVQHLKLETSHIPLHVWQQTFFNLLIEDHLLLLSTLKLPTLILWGANDSAYDRADQIRLRAALPHAAFHEYPELGHCPHYEAPSRVANDLLEFLGERSRVDSESSSGESPDQAAS